MSFNPSYVTARNDMLDFVPTTVNRMMDVGCSVGAFGEKVMSMYPRAEVYGIEIQPEMANVAMQKLTRVVVADIEQCSLASMFGADFFDCIVFADVLEHLRDPWKVLGEAVDALAAGGTIVACVPNIRHIDTIFNLVFRGIWPYRDRGIHDRTHLRFFTRKNLNQLFDDPALRVDKIVAKYRIIERQSRINRFSRLFALPLIREFFTFQYIIVATKVPVAADKLAAN